MKTVRSIKLSAERIERFRVAKVLSVAELSRRAKLTRNTVWRAKRGCPVDFGSARRLAAALEVDVSEIVVHDEDLAGEPAAGEEAA